MNAATFTITASGHALETDDDKFGFLRDSSPAIDNVEALRGRYKEDGYLYIKNFFDLQDVLAARRYVAERLLEDGMLDAGTDMMDCVARPGTEPVLRPDATSGNQALMSMLYQGRMIAFYERFLGGSIRHFDYTWFRSVGPGRGTLPHCDIVYMGRGTHDLMTAWVPLGDIPLQIGGLTILENSHRQQDRLKKYLSSDVDVYCTNGRHAPEIENGKKTQERPGYLSKNPVSLQRSLGGRWLTADFKAGDLLTFGMKLIHASLDNQSDRIRLSSDSRYQLACAKADERWIGPTPIGHSLAGKRGRIC